MTRLRNLLRKPDTIAILLLIALWMLFFWRLFTPNIVDRTQLIDGDFNGQFVAFGAYQYERFSAGEIPLWNPYNNGGLPFIADTQAAVFYPPRLITIVISNLSGGWTQHSLQIEMTVHILLYTLFMYALVRRLTLTQTGSIYGGIIAAVIAGYGGFMSGYPPLQLALLEAGIWLPLGLIGILEATRRDILNSIYLLWTALAIGLSWMAGHPQTALFVTYTLAAYYIYRCYTQSYHWPLWIFGVVGFGTIAVGLTAVQLLPGLEYTSRTMRNGLSFVDKGNGFPFQDIIQFVLPGVVSLYSPLFVGITGLLLAAIAITRKGKDYVFWSAIALISLALSFGTNSALYHIFYNIVPGFSLFRGQERAAYLVSISLAILAGIGVPLLISTANADNTRLKRIIIAGIATLTAILALITTGIFIAWLGNAASYGNALSTAFFSLIITTGSLIIVAFILNKPEQHLLIALTALIIFELFSINVDNVNYTAAQADPLAPPPLVEQILTAQEQDDESLFRVDGNFVGLYGNYGTLFGIQDIRGISPLFLDGPHAIIQRELPSEVAWELFAVRYVLTEAEEIPAESQLIGNDFYGDTQIYLHEILTPRPYATLLYNFEVVDSDEFARALLADPRFDERNTVILHDAPEITLPDEPPTSDRVEIIKASPESITISVIASTPAILSLAHVDYPGWNATLNGESIELIRAYGGLSALAIPEGAHTVILEFQPTSFTIGAVLSLVTWMSLSILCLYSVIQYGKRHVFGRSVAKSTSTT